MPEAEEVAIGGDGVQLVADGLWLALDDGYPAGTALEAHHRLVHGEVPARDVVSLEEALALVVEGVRLLDDGLPLCARDRRFDVEVAVKFKEAVAGHALRAVGVAVVLLVTPLIRRNAVSELWSFGTWDLSFLGCLVEFLTVRGSGHGFDPRRSPSSGTFGIALQTGVTLLPVVVQLRKDDDTLADTDT